MRRILLAAVLGGAVASAAPAVASTWTYTFTGGANESGPNLGSNSAGLGTGDAFQLQVNGPITVNPTDVTTLLSCSIASGGTCTGVDFLPGAGSPGDELEIVYNDGSFGSGLIHGYEFAANTFDNTGTYDVVNTNVFGTLVITTSVPEPLSLGTFAAGLLGLGLLQRRRRG